MECCQPGSSQINHINDRISDRIKPNINHQEPNMLRKVTQRSLNYRIVNILTITVLHSLRMYSFLLFLFFTNDFDKLYLLDSMNPLMITLLLLKI